MSQSVLMLGLKVRQVSETTVLSQRHAYMLFYVRNPPGSSEDLATQRLYKPVDGQASSTSNVRSSNEFDQALQAKNEEKKVLDARIVRALPYNVNCSESTEI